MNGIFILGILAVAAIYTCVGYFWGKSDEQKREIKELGVLNGKINEVLGNKGFEVMSPKDIE